MKTTKKIKTEGNIQNLKKDSNTVVTSINTEIPQELNKLQKEDNQSFENFKKLYGGVIDIKCNQEYGSTEDTKLWEDCAKELFLQSKTYIVNGDEFKSKDNLSESKSLKENNQEYRYITNHGIGSGMVPNNTLIRSEDLPSGKTAIYLNRPLTDEELKKYDIKSEWIQESKKVEDKSVKPYIKRCKDILLKCFDWIENHITEDDYVKMLEYIGLDDLSLNEVNPRNCTEIVVSCLAWIIEHASEDEKKSIFKDQIGLSEDEIAYFAKSFDYELSESKKVEEARDEVAEELSKFIYDLTSDEDNASYGYTAWSGNAPTTMGGTTVYEVYKNGQSHFDKSDIKDQVLSTFPELNVYGESLNSIFFYKKNQKKVKARKLTRAEFNKEFGEGANPDIINAGREPEERIEIVDESKLQEDLDMVNYKVGQLNKVDGDINDEYTIKISNKTKEIETNYLNVNKDVINFLKSYFEKVEVDDDKIEESKLQEDTTSIKAQVGQEYLNKYGSRITIIEPEEPGKVQFRITNTESGLVGDVIEVESFGVLNNILEDNGYELIESTENKAVKKESFTAITTQTAMQDIADYINSHFSNQIKAETAIIDDAAGIKLTRKGNNIDLINLCDAITKAMKVNGLEVEDYDILLKGNDLVIAAVNKAIPGSYKEM